MKRLTLAFLFAWVPGAVLAAGGHVHTEPANIDLANQQSLQRGAKLFTNYCLSCHSAGYARYNRVARDIGISDAQAEEFLINGDAKVGNLMTIAMRRDDAKAWFGAPPPDLTLTARVRGSDWIYTYLKSFYLDESRPFGVNNTVFPNVGMPHVLWELQGWQALVHEEDGQDHGGAPRFEKVSAGSMTDADYDKAVRDLTNFMTYMAEPVRLERQRLGVWVILFLIGFGVLAYLLKKEYWKDIH